MSSLWLELEDCVPIGTELISYHVSTPPTRCAPLYNPPSNTPPQKTYCESQSLLVTYKLYTDVDVNEDSDEVSDKKDKNHEVAVFAIEAQIYTTEDLTTVFVSKADSTGYQPERTGPEPKETLLRAITRTFVSYIVRHRHRNDRKLVLSLFARAQDQYLFPGSVENKKKHVLSDRQLIRWWCRTLDKVVREYPNESRLEAGDVLNPGDTIASRAHLIVPGCDTLETRRFISPDVEVNEESGYFGYWHTTSPLRDITPYPTGPPRCQVPHFPDDPKARFLAELDDEIADASSSSSQPKQHESPMKRGAGQWTSAKTLEQFWELMAFRSECSSGRLVGFIWIIFTPKELLGVDSQVTNTTAAPSPLKRKAPPLCDEPQEPVLKKQKTSPATRIKSSGPIMARAPRLKPGADGYLAAPQVWESKYFQVPERARGTLKMDQKSYDRGHDFLLKLDFADINIACRSTMKWIEGAAIIAGKEGSSWGTKVRGSMHVPVEDDVADSTSQSLARSVDKPAAPNILTAKKKSKVTSQSADELHIGSRCMINAASNPKIQDGCAHVPSTSSQNSPKKTSLISCDPSGQGHATSGAINLLGAGLVRKKAKT